ncbi:tape measure protein [Bifidobacterium pseudolongum]|uniref:Tape measure domain-containing protein n=1 Tax=Bifidobacterium pseudolongum subsp. globosum TaxID=1690 RepID=A0A4Q5AV72_9BIFI|nr:tape measure protein [Bifidobacterium pseudolongum]RYQ36506.1 tape measure domain-containing protein [Bifidobacterium pseudolongum subsp. globosum]
MASKAIQLATAYVQIVPSMKGVGNAIVSAFDGASGKAGISGGKAAGSGFAGGLKAKMGAVIGAASAITSKAMDTIGSSISSAVSRADQMNNFPKVMKNLGYSSEDAAKSIKKISDSLDGLPTTSSAMTGMVQQLAPLTSNLDEATTISLAFNNAMLAGGASTMEQENALAQYTQMLSAGTVDMAAWRSIQAAMPGQLNQVAEAMMGAGHNANDLYEAMKDGTYSFDDFNKAIVDLNENGFGQYASFAQQAKDATQGIGTAIENVKNRVAKAVQKVIEAFGVENIAGAINTFSSQFGKIGDAAASMVTVTKNQFSLLWDRVKDLGAIDTLKTAWDGLTAKLSNTDWGNLLPSGVWEQLRNTAASALADVMDRISQLIGWLSNGIQWVTSFVQSFASTGVFQAWIDVLGVVCDIVQSTWDAFSSVLDVFGQMTGAAGGAQSFGQMVGDAFKTIADLIKPVLQKLDDLVNWFSEHSEFVVSALAGIGGAFAVFKTAQIITSVVDKFNGFRQAVLLATEATGGLKLSLPVIQDALKAIGTSAGPIGPALHGVVGKISGLSTAAKAAGGGIKGLSSALGLGPWGLIATAIAAVVSALVWFFTQTEVGRKAWAAFTSWLGDAWQKICEVGKAVWEGLASFFSGLWEGISSVAQSVWGGISSFFTGIWDGVSSVWNTVWNGVQTVFEAVWGFIQAYVQNVIMPIGEFIKNCFIVVAAVFVTIWNGIKAVWETVWNAIVAFFTPIIEGISNTITTVCTFISETWNTVWTAISSFFQNIWNALVAFFTPIIDGIANTISTVIAAIQATWNSVWGAISSFFQNIWNSIVAFLSPIVNVIRNTITGAVTAIQSTWTTIWNSISSFFSGIWNGMRNAVGNAVGFIGDKVRGIKDIVFGALAGAGGWLRDTGRNLIQGLINGIGDMFGWVRDKICSLGDSILGWAKGVLGIGSPSRIFKQYGQWLDEGLAIGIDDAASRVGKAMDEMTGMVIGKGLDFGVEARINAANMPGWDASATRPYVPPHDATGKSGGSTTTVYQTINNPVAQPWPIQSSDDSDHRFQDA